MIRQAALRLVLALPTAAGVVLAVFTFLHLVPGDPVDVMLGESAAPADRAALARALGLDQPLAVQLGKFTLGALHGDLGRSLASDESVAALIAARYPATLELAAAALTFAVALALPLGTLAAARPGSFVDRLSLAIAVLGASIPTFWLGPLLILCFAIALDWLPVSGRGGPAHLVLPAAALGFGMAASLTRQLRASLGVALRLDCVRTARAKGLRPSVVFLRHALRNAASAVVTLLGLQIGGLLAGSIIVETIFAWPGLGRLLVQAIGARDYPLVQGCVLTIALTYVAINLITDLTYAAIDPRLRRPA
jgi:peptide/nickel transport system permease protein